MSVDPYHAVQQDIQVTLQTTQQLLASYVRIRSTARDDSEELGLARNELTATLATLDADLEALEESVKVVESADARYFGLDDTEVQRRRRYVSSVRHDIDNMRAEVKNPTANTSRRFGATSSSNDSRGLHTPAPAGYPLSPLNLGHDENGNNDDQSAWELEEQQMMIRQQDQTIDSIAGTISTIQQQAALMGQEISEHHEILGDLETAVDHTDSRLGEASKKLKKLLRDAEERGSGWCIVFLIVMLAVLLLLVILL